MYIIICSYSLSNGNPSLPFTTYKKRFLISIIFTLLVLLKQSSYPTTKIIRQFMNACSLFSLLCH